MKERAGTPQTTNQTAENLQDNKMIIQNSAVNRADFLGVRQNAFESRSSSRAPKTNDFWLYGALFGLVSGAVGVIFGLVFSAAVWMSGQWLADSNLGIFSTWLLIASFGLFFIGGYCLDKAYEPFHRRSDKTEK